MGKYFEVTAALGKYFEVTAALGKYFEVTAALGKYFEVLPCSNFLKEMVSGSKLKCPSKVSGEVSLTFYYSVICSNCLGNVLVGTKNVEKCGKNVKKCEKCGKMCWSLVLYILLTGHSSLQPYDGFKSLENSHSKIL